MRKTETFVHPLPGFGGTYPNNWAGYVHLQTRDAEGLPNLRHIGDDLNGPGGGDTDLGLKVISTAPGFVEKIILWNGNAGYGNHLFVKHELTPQLREAIKRKFGIDTDVIYSHYAHLKDIFVKEGQEVDIGQQIATCGKSGTKWAHLHFEIRKPTGKGYENYPSSKADTWVKDFYFTPFTLVEAFKDLSYLPPAPPDNTTRIRAFINVAIEALNEALKLLK